MQLVNTGRFPANVIELSIMNATKASSEPPSKLFLPGTPYHATLDAADPEDVWLFLMYSDPIDRKKLYAEWMPLIGATPLGDRLLEQLDESKRALVWKRLGSVLRLKKPQPVGPDGTWIQRIPLGRMSREKDLLVVGKEVLEERRLKVI